MATSAAARVFAVTELLEAILLRVESTVDFEGYEERPVLQLFTLQRVSREFQATIIGSEALQRMLVLNQYPSYHQYGISLDFFIATLDEKISTAWQNSEADRAESWRAIKVNHQDTKHALLITHSSNAADDFPESLYSNGSISDYVGMYRTTVETTLGALRDWELRMEARIVAELRERVNTRRREQLERCADRRRTSRLRAPSF